MSDRFGPGYVVLKHKETGETESRKLSGEIRLDGVLETYEIVDYDPS